MKIALVLLAVALMINLVCGCSTQPQVSNPNAPAAVAASAPTQEVEYSDNIAQFTKHASKYAGFNEIYEFHATLRNSTVQSAQLQHQSSFYHWDSDELERHTEAMNRTLETKTEIFLSLYTASPDNNRLTSSSNPWHAYLTVNSRRYPAKIKHVKGDTATIAVLYPYFNRWSKAYMLEFQIPTSEVDASDSLLTITGPLGSKSVLFSKGE